MEIEERDHMLKLTGGGMGLEFGCTFFDKVCGEGLALVLPLKCGGETQSAEDHKLLIPGSHPSPTPTLNPQIRTKKLRWKTLTGPWYS